MYTYSKIQLRTDVNSCTLELVGWHQVAQCPLNGDGCYLGKLGPIHRDVWFDCSTHIDDLEAYVFAFAIAIRPNNQTMAPFNLM